MNSIYFFSGPCGVGKSTLSDLFAQRLASDGRQVYLIHGDDFHASLFLPEDQSCFTEDGNIRDPEQWNRIIGFNWRCLLDMAANALDAGMDVVIDYVIEQELPQVTALARSKDAALYYFLLTASREALAERITCRGDTDMLGRALFLKEKLEGLPESRGHLLDTTGLSPEAVLNGLRAEAFRVQ